MNIEIDVNINKWVKDYDPITINKILKIGYFMYTEFNFDINPLENQFNSIKSDISVYNENLIDLKMSIDTLRGISKSSSSKGKLMENYVEHVIKDNFPDDNLDIVSGTGHESDMHLHFNNTGNGADNTLQAILVEVKAYTDTVNTKEIDKFYRDMDRVGYKGGIFISISSGIVGFKRFDIRRLKNNNIAIFLPNTGLNSASIVWSILFLKEYLGFYNNNADTNNSDKMYDIFIKNITHIFYQFEEEYSNISRLRFDIRSSRNKIDDIMDGLYRQTLDLEIRMKGVLESSKKRIWTHLVEYRSDIGDNTIVHESEYSDFIETMRENRDKNLEHFIHIKTLLMQFNLFLHKEPGKNIHECKLFYVYSGTNDVNLNENNVREIIFKIKKMRDKLEIIFTEPNISIEPRDMGLEIIENILNKKYKNT